MWYRVTGRLVIDVARQRGGLILKDRDAHSSSNISTLGDETATISRNVGRQSSNEMAPLRGESGELEMYRCESLKPRVVCSGLDT
jgi:hypothetical protein